ncbi:hypothetical protein [Allopusillimonas ginsengisoli]|uniref:hypothetical protein n=1 Tax=Allopusillimonas ginsengisoli TaxID=453575 RepID=UPI001021A08E|nr:hypothetical protein [Allopusillimonas ginsengisoli]TEA78269.1 hypothetical protein ERE07_10680 [Allopusillimonas ginsengisoli]
MNRTITAALGIVLCAGLAACGTTRDKEGDLAQKTVEYKCGTGNGESLTAQYTFQGQEALGAKVIFGDQVVDLTRSTSSNADMVGNTFRGNGYTWTTDKFTYDTAGEANGTMLTQDAAAGQAGASQAGSATVLARECKAISAS